MASIVVLQGMHYEVPDWARWITQDAQCRVVVHEDEPQAYGHVWGSFGRSREVGGPAAPMVKQAIS